MDSPYRSNQLQSAPSESPTPKWARMLLIAILSTSTLRASDTAEDSILNHLVALPATSEARLRSAQSYFEAGMACYYRNDLEGTISNFEIVNRILPSQAMEDNIVEMKLRSLGYNHRIIHPLQQNPNNGAEWNEMSPTELIENTAYSAAVRRYEQDAQQVNEQDRLVTLQLVTGEISDRAFAFRRLSEVQTSLIQEIKVLRESIRHEDATRTLGNGTWDSCEPFHEDAFEDCLTSIIEQRQRVIKLEQEERRLKTVTEALTALGNTL